MFACTFKKNIYFKLHCVLEVHSLYTYYQWVKTTAMNVPHQVLFVNAVRQAHGNSLKTDLGLLTFYRVFVFCQMSADPTRSVFICAREIPSGCVKKTNYFYVVSLAKSLLRKPQCISGSVLTLLPVFLQTILVFYFNTTI